MGRISLLDGLRGACLVFMTITHLRFEHAFLVGHLHFKELGFADSAQGFIFLSGLLVGMVGMRQYVREGSAAVGRRYRRRAAELYGWHLGLLLLLLLASRLLPDAWLAWGNWLQHLFEDGNAYALATAALLYQPTYLDILPQYILYLLAAPLLLRLIANGHGGAVLAGMLVLWLVAQAGLDLKPMAAFERAVVIGDTDVVLRSGFNPLGWQLAFGAGLLIGAYLERGSLRVEHLFRPDRTFLPQLALGLLAGFAVFRLVLTFGLLDDPSIARFATAERRQTLGLLTAVNFAALAYLVGWLLTAAPERPEGWLRRLGLGLRALFGHPFLTLLGRHSLPVFVFHVALVYALRYLDSQLGGIPDPWFSLLALLAIASLFLVAAALETRRKSVPRAAARSS